MPYLSYIKYHIYYCLSIIKKKEEDIDYHLLMKKCKIQGTVLSLNEIKSSASHTNLI